MALYQRRHSDTKASAGTVFGCFAGLILLNVLGVYWFAPSSPARSHKQEFDFILQLCCVHPDIIFVGA
jgi:hypothetical protein